jgi:molybdopterin/thiamine biosynthesis adenylyltransferase
MSEDSSRRAFLRALGARAAQRFVPPDVAREPEPEMEEEEIAVEDVLPEEDVDRYARQLVLPEWSAAAQLKLREANVLVVGLGALGSPAAAYLAGAGIGRLGILDGGIVELSNLHRQFLHYTPDVGVAKTWSASAKLGFLNPDVLVEPFQMRIDSSNAADVIAGQDLVVDCSDTFETRYAVNAACCAAGVDLVEGGVVGLSGLVMAIRPGESACYRCAFPEPPANAPSCAQAGILGPAAGVIGSPQALEALKLIGGVGEPLLDAFLQLDLATNEVIRVGVARRPGCPDCG